MLYILSVIAALVSAANIDGDLGVDVQLTAGAHVVSFVEAGGALGGSTPGPQLEIEVDADCTLRLSIHADASYSGWVAGGSTLSLNGGVGYTLEVTPNTVTIGTPKLTTPAIDISIITSLTGAANFGGFLKVGANAEASSAIVIDPVELNALEISATLPGRGTYVLINFDKEIDVAGTSAKVTAHAEQSFKFASGVTVKSNTEASGEITCEETTATGSGDMGASIGTSLDVYFSIELTGSSSSSSNHNSELRYTVTTAQKTALGVSTAAEANIRWAYFDEDNNQWKLPSTGASIEGDVVIQSTTHFSKWGMYATDGQQGAASALSPSILSVLALAAAVMGFRA